MWTSTSAKISTCDNLMKRGVPMAKLGCMCRRCGESMDHLLLHCDKNEL